ncbi:hypothetical protein [Pseudooceanicola sp.]|uniref:hypothetical protein n=1 Tax=Pseudooceanicola sp. TaxID=1914328 RepID=UPI00262FBAA5|nr:hypothetical protein [Pseudooceanicola sp.]MDF1856698.1 hypothetical protein [Pseudooceanicola sp.]
MNLATTYAAVLVAALLLLLGGILALTGPALAAEQGEGTVAGLPVAPATVHFPTFR